MLVRLLSSLLLTLTFLASPAVAQINLDIPETETPDGDGSNPGGGLEGYCVGCCAGGVSDPGCCDACGCQCGLLGCNTYSYMGTAQIPLHVNIAVRKSVNEGIDRLERTERGKRLASVLINRIDRLTAIYEKAPELQGRTARAMVKFWPWDMWTKGGDAGHKVTPEAMQELRGILTTVSRIDADMGGSEIGATIDKEVLPQLTRALVGRPYDEAFACFIGAAKCD